MKDRDQPPILREALLAARTQVPDQADLARLAARLPLVAGGPAGGGNPPTGAPPPVVAAPPSMLSGVTIGAALGLTVAGAGFVWQAAHQPSASPPAASASVLRENVPTPAALQVPE